MTCSLPLDREDAANFFLRYKKTTTQRLKAVNPKNANEIPCVTNMFRLPSDIKRDCLIERSRIGSKIKAIITGAKAKPNFRMA